VKKKVCFCVEKDTTGAGETTRKREGYEEGGGEGTEQGD